METTTSPLPPTDSARREASEFVALLQASDIFRDYQRAFQSITGLPLALRAAGSYQPPMQGTKLGNPLCALLAGRNKTCAACLDLQQRLEQTACAQPGTAQCFAGLNESAVPIRLGEKIIAYLQTGQVLFHLPTAAESRQAARQAAALEPTLDRKEVSAAFRQSRVVARAQYDAILRLLAIFAQQLAALSNQLMVKQSLAEAPVITRARAYITAHLSEDLSLVQVSQAVGMSSFYFCKNFKKGTGLNFTEYLSRQRVEAVKQLLLNPYKRVSEAAYEAGFQSLSQFNRVFHRIVGESPSLYREQLHAPTRAASHHRLQACAA
ncbi:helix-turn-helix domain-containing protein [Opitutus sp. GAS368]|uniref:PocR ligand-binding domain-containing protein n=1 Tax=Opitutus sp. GAS368 TaxID=1882749 RepID=UPI00087D046A|nr:helix-turn-helix domain-containing protein [Opitutus sp. GAS368]SDS44772.1 transcriptional regulator, AraC family [Opitutus sp. GAS368]